MHLKHVVLLVLLVVFPYTKCQTDRYCWPESERNTLTFANTTNKMEYLPTIRFSQGYWPSQSAIQYVGYIFLKEKMGVNVEFFPLLNSGLTVADTLDDQHPYPFNYWQYIEENIYDILLETWHVNGDNKYYDRGTVLHGGINELYGEINLYIPRYIYNEFPNSIVLSELKNNNILRQQFIDAYTINSNKDWIKYWNNTLYNNSNLLSEYLSYGFDLPSYDIPTIFGSLFGYEMTKHSKGFIKSIIMYNDTIGLDWNFIPLGSETLLSEFVIDLYNNKQPFIANLYSPHTDFSTVSELTNEYMQFEHIGMPRNADNSREDQCWIQYQCEEPITPLFKLVNPKLKDDLPEIIQFVYDFQMLNEDLNEILFHQQENGDWFNASCIWLRENEDKISEWYHNIIRYDCSMFDGGCGYTYKEVMNIGGYCANSSIEPLCICTDPILGGKQCRTSCPGLRGPFYKSGEWLNDSYYYFEECNNNGECDTTNWSCKCNDGYSGDSCGSTQFDWTLFIIIVLLVLLVIIIIILGLVMYRRRNEHKINSQKLEEEFDDEMETMNQTE
eukprot:118343_1